jgi:hypothetical protein
LVADEILYNKDKLTVFRNPNQPQLDENNIKFSSNFVDQENINKIHKYKNYIYNKKAIISTNNQNLKVIHSFFFLLLLLLLLLIIIY